MKIEINNMQYLKVYIKENSIIVEKYNEKNKIEAKRIINEVEFVDLYNILVYAQDYKKEIFRLWDAK